MTATAHTIVERLDLTLDRMQAEGMQPRRIYLDVRDYIEFGSQSEALNPSRFRHRNVEVAEGNRSIVYSRQGVARAVIRPRKPVHAA
jgi:hypothetical protein